MSDILRLNGGGKPAPVTLTITKGSSGVAVNGPLTDKGLCYLMLEMARDAIFDFHAKQVGSGISTSLAPPPTDTR